MMENIRSAANSIVVKIIFAIIMLCFIFTGVGFLSFGGGNSARDEQQYIAKVDGDGISRAVFENQVKRETSNAGEKASDPEFVKQLRQEILTSQINNYLMSKFSNNLNVKISNEQIKDAIRKEPLFFVNGKFNNKKYLDVLAQYNYTPDRYAEVLKTELKKQQVSDVLTKSLFVLPVDSELSLLKDQTRVIYASSINSSVLNIAPVIISKEDEQKYYKEHANEFSKNERIKFNYIKNTRKDISDKVSVSYAELKQEYKNNQQEYQVAGKKSYSIIYVTDKDKADKISSELTTSNFEQMAKSGNDDNQISQYGKNGSLGWFIDDASLPQPFKDANLNSKGQISKPIRVDDGYLIIKLDDIQPVQTKDFNLVKEAIKTKLIEQKTDKIFQQKENVLHTELAKNSEPLDEIAKKVELKAVESDWTDDNDDSSILSYPEVRDIAFGSEMLVDGKATGKISDIIPVGNLQEDSVVIQVIDYRPEGVAPFDEVQKDIHQKLYVSQTKERLQSAVNNLMAELNEKGKSNKIAFSTSYSLKRDSNTLDKKVVDMVFNLVPSEKKPTFGVQFTDDNNGYIVMLQKVEPSTKQRDISEELLSDMNRGLQYYLSLDLNAKTRVDLMPDANL